MIFVKLILAALVFPMMLGYIALSLISKKGDLYPLEILALAYAMGVGFLTFIMFIIGWMLIPFNVSYILIASLAVFLCPLFICIKYKRFLSLNFRETFNSMRGLKWFEVLLFFIIALRIFLSYFQALIKPVQEIDSLTYRMMEAKIFFIEKGLSLNQPLGYFIGPTAHKHYPLNISLFSSWIYASLGAWNDHLVKIIFPTFLLAFAIVFFYAIRRITSRPASLFSTYLLLSLPFLIYHSSTSYIDAVVGFYYFTSFIFLLLFIRKGDISYFIISALLAGICTWTKNDGLPLILSNLIVLFVYQAFIKKDSFLLIASRFMQYLSGILLFQLPWSAFKFIFRDKIPVPAEIPNFSHIFDYYSRIPVILEFYYKKTLFYGNWNIAWFVLILVLLMTVLRRRLVWENIFVLFAIIWGMISFGSVYCLSSNSWPGLLDGTVQNRNFLTFTALVVYFICISIFRDDNNVMRRSK